MRNKAYFPKKKTAVRKLHYPASYERKHWPPNNGSIRSWEYLYFWCLVVLRFVDQHVLDKLWCIPTDVAALCTLEGSILRQGLQSCRTGVCDLRSAGWHCTTRQLLLLQLCWQNFVFGLKTNKKTNTSGKHFSVTHSILTTKYRMLYSSLYRNLHCQLKHKKHIKTESLKEQL